MKEDKIIRAIIVDDEENSRNLLEKLLFTFLDIQVMGLAECVDDAVSLVVETEPELVFLDISMPGKDGFDFIKELNNLNRIPEIIFVTAFDQFAIQAFKVSAFDYLLKPIDISSLEETLSRYRQRRNNAAFTGKVSVLLDQLGKKNGISRIKFPTRTGTIFLNPDKIAYCIADGNYTKLVTDNLEEYTIPKNIGMVKTLFTDSGFERVGRSLIINLSYLVGIDRKHKSVSVMCKDKTISFGIPLKALKELENLL